jgi:hypothetical protein
MIGSFRTVKKEKRHEKAGSADHSTPGQKRNHAGQQYGPVGDSQFFTVPDMYPTSVTLSSGKISYLGKISVMT